MELTTSALALPLLLTPPAADQAVELKYEPAGGSTLSSTVEFTLESSTAESYWTFDGERIEADFLDEKEVRAQFAFSDTIERAAQGRPQVFARTFDELEATFFQEVSGEAAGEGGSLEVNYESPLAGETIEYTWDADLEEYEFELADGNDDDLLAAAWSGSAYDLTFANLVPGEEVSVGDSWEVDGFVFGMLLVDPWLEFGLEGDDYQARRSLENKLRRPRFDHPRAEWLSGTVTAELGEVREDDEGRQLAVIQIELELEGDFPYEFEDEDTGATFSGGEKHEFELEGEAVWDVAGGHLVRLELEGTEDKEELQGISHPDEGDQESVDRLSGPISLVVEVAASNG